MTINGVLVTAKPDVGIKLSQAANFDLVEDICRLLECRTVEVVRSSQGFCIYVDEEGLFKRQIPAWSVEIDGNRIQLVGNLLFVGGTSGSWHRKDGS